VGSDPRGKGAGLLDHLTKGRVYAGFARGYQDRWVNVLGQQYHVTGAPMEGSAIDNHNRRVYEETLKVIKKAWTEDAWECNGEYYKVPYPYEEGIRRWPVADWTRTYGTPGEVDEEGVIRKICVVPKPYQQPHSPMFQPFSVSEATIRYTAQSGIVPAILTAYPPDFQRLCRMYQEVATEAGRTYVSGKASGLSVPSISTALKRRQSRCCARPITPASTTTSAVLGSAKRSARPRMPPNTRPV